MSSVGEVIQADRVHLGKAGHRERAEEGASSNTTLPEGKVGDRMML